MKLLSLILMTALLLTLTTPSKIYAKEEYVTYDTIETGNQVVVTLNNISSQTVSLTARIDYYDSQNIETEYSKDLITFEPGKTAFIAFDNPAGYKSYKVKVTANVDYYLKGTGVLSSVTASTTSFPLYDLLLSYIKNTSSETVNISYSMVYYKNDEIIYVSNRTFELKSNYSYMMIEECPYGYDGYIINLNESYY